MQKTLFKNVPFRRYVGVFWKWPVFQEKITQMSQELGLVSNTVAGLKYIKNNFVTRLVD